MRYQCQRCGNCCRWPGWVHLKEGEAEQIAELLGMDVMEFTCQYTKLHPDRTHLVLFSKPNGECIFLEGKNHCKIQGAKPAQCRGFPNEWRFEGWRDVCEAIEIPD